ncbi:MAG: hypothetical protein KJ069_31435, partial [Anaerolineae bacterium]|nr:hypothetical protein [Anaerolineae bacterium]
MAIRYRMLPALFLLSVGLLLGCGSPETPTRIPTAAQSPPPSNEPSPTPAADITTIPAEPTADSSPSVVATAAIPASTITTEPEVV